VSDKVSYQTWKGSPLPYPGLQQLFVREADAMWSNVTVFLAEDDDQLRPMLRRVLEGQTFRVRTFAEVYQLVGAIDDTEHPADILLLDVQLLNGTALPAMEAWSRKRRGPCLVFSGQLSTEDLVEYYSVGAWTVLEKPVDLRVLQRLMQTYASAVLQTKENEQLRRMQQTLTRWLLVVSMLVMALLGERGIPLLVDLFK